MRSTLVSALVLLGFVALVSPVAKTRFLGRAQPPAPPQAFPATAPQQPRSLPALGAVPPLPASPQPPAPNPQPQRVEPIGFAAAAGQTAYSATQATAKAPINPNQVGWAGRMEKDLNSLPPLTKQMLLTSRRGADWLSRMNGVKGLFSPGIEPAIREEAADEGMLRQIGSAWALNRAAQAFADPKYEARALQSMLCALEETTVDPTDPKARHTSVPQVLMPRLFGTALLALALVDQPSPPSDMVERSEELVNYLRREAQNEVRAKSATGTQATHPAGQRYLVAYTLLKSNKVRPAPWKPELAAALLESANGPVDAQAQPWQGLALAEWSRTRGDREAAARLYAACEELVRWQQSKLNPAHPRQLGGFQPPVASGNQPAGSQLAPPTTTSSSAILLTLAEAATLSREMGDATRNQALMEAIDRGTQFIAQNQYTEATTQHFAEWYRPLLEGGFRDTERAGTLSLGTQQMALMAMVQSLRASAP
jgi:hypothetical protein